MVDLLNQNMKDLNDFNFPLISKIVFWELLLIMLFISMDNYNNQISNSERNYIKN